MAFPSGLCEIFDLNYLYNYKIYDNRQGTLVFCINVIYNNPLTLLTNITGI